MNYKKHKAGNIPEGRFRCCLALELSVAKEQKVPINAKRRVEKISNEPDEIYDYHKFPLTLR